MMFLCLFWHQTCVQIFFFDRLLVHLIALSSGLIICLFKMRDVRNPGKNMFE